MISCGIGMNWDIFRVWVRYLICDRDARQCDRRISKSFVLVAGIRFDIFGGCSLRILLKLFL